MTINWDEIRRNKFAAQSGPPDWDRSVRDPQGRLYWDGQRIAVESLRLSRWQKIGAVVVTLSTAIAALTVAIVAEQRAK